MICRQLVFLLAVSTGFAAGAEELLISKTQLDNLGVVVGQPDAVEFAEDFSAPALVKVPPENDFAVVPLHAGTIKRLAVAPGESVRKGDPIAWIMSQEFLAAQHAYNDAMHSMGLAQKQLDRDITLHDEGIVSDRRLDQAQHAVHELELRTKTIEQSLKLAGMTNSEIKKLNDSQDLRLEMIIRSPVDGIVLEQYGVAGQRLDGSDPVYRIADLSKLWLEIDVPVSRSSDIFPETIVLINPQRDSTRAHILHVGRNVNKENQTVVVRAVIDDGSSLSPGQFVSAVVTKGGDRGYYELPANSIVQHEGGSYIFIRSADGVVVREVSILRHSRGRVVIAEGISGDESVVIEGAVALKAQWLGMGGGE